MNSEYSIGHKKCIIVKPESLIELNEILESARSIIIAHIAIDNNVTMEKAESIAKAIESDEETDDEDYKIVRDIKNETLPSYSVKFKSGYRPTKPSVKGLLETIKNEPDAPIELEFRIGQSYSGLFSVRIGSIYGDNVSVKITGHEDQAEAIVRKLRNWLKNNEPDYAWARSNLFRFFSSVIGSTVIVLLFRFVWSKTFTEEWTGTDKFPEILKFTSGVIFAGWAIVVYWAQKETFPQVEFLLGWSQRKIKVRRSLLAAAIGLVALPILLHFLNLT